MYGFLELLPIKSDKAICSIVKNFMDSIWSIILGFQLVLLGSRDVCSSAKSHISTFEGLLDSVCGIVPELVSRLRSVYVLVGVLLCFN